MIKFTQKLKSFFVRSALDPAYWEELEETLLSSDVGLPVTKKIIEQLKSLKSADEVKIAIKGVMAGMVRTHSIELKASPHIIMVVGVNGTGKTTTIAKLGNRYKKAGKKVMLVAADTFRAAAVDQLQIWGDRIGAAVHAQGYGADSAAVAFDAVVSAQAKGVDLVIIDTAGRLHTNKNLMDELAKVKRVIGKAIAEGSGHCEEPEGRRGNPVAPHDIILVLDSTVGQNGLQQAKVFNEVLGLTGIIISKMDGTAKGGVILSIAEELALPVSFIGTGEKIDDLEPFSPDLLELS